MKKNILHVTKYLPPYKGGIEYVTEKFAQAAINAGANVRIAGIRGANTPTNINKYWENIELKSVGKFGPVELAPGYFHLERHFEWADIIHLHLPNPLAELASILNFNADKSLLNKRLIPIFHAPTTHFPLITRIVENFIQVKVLRQAESILMVSPKLLNIRKATMAFHDKAIAIPFPTEYPKEITSAGPNSAESEDIVNILAIGRLVEYKGFIELTKALGKIKDLNWQLNIIGQGPLEEKLKALGEQLGIEKRIHFLGKVSDPQKHQELSGCDLFVMPSTSTQEGYGIVLAEAFSYGRPAVVSNIETGVNYLNRLGKCGALCEPRDVESLVKGLRLMIENKDRRHKAGTENKAFWQNNLTFTAFEQRYLTALGEATNINVLEPAEASKQETPKLKSIA